MEFKTLLEKLELSTFIAFDFETTGLDPQQDRIIELAAVKFVNGEPGDQFVTLLNPGKPIPEFITDITGISNAMVKDMPGEADVIDDFIVFLGETPLVAHNIPFDISFLKALRERFNKPEVAHELYDTLSLSRAVLFDQPAFNLGSIAEYYKLNTENAHRAESDTINCGKIFLRMIEELASYPLAVLSKVVTLIKPTSIPNKALYINLANELLKTGDLKSGLVSVSKNHYSYSNIFSWEGVNNIKNISGPDLFAAGGMLSHTMDGYEERIQQTHYSEFVEEILTKEPQIGVAEAGTGLGKSMAYLFPALKRYSSNKDDGPVIISCYTKHLQDQLFYKDLPMLARALDVSLQAAVLKGRHNYICLTRFNWLISDAKKLLNPKQIESLIPIVIWLEWTKTGDLAECNGLWSARPGRVVSFIRCEQGFCTTNLCNKQHGCYFGKIRKAVFEADILIVNHSLLLSELNGNGFLPAHNTVIIDEGHNLVGTAYNQFTVHLDQIIAVSLVQCIDPSRPGNVRWNNMLNSIGQLHPSITEFRKKLQIAAKESISAVISFFEIISLHSQTRYHPDDVYTRKIIIKNLEEELGSVRGEIIEVEANLENLSSVVERIGKELLALDASKQDYPLLHQVFRQHLDDIIGLQRLLTTVTSNQNPEMVYWQEGIYKPQKNGPEQLNISLYAAPVDVAEVLQAKLFQSLDYCLITSATLRVDEAFDYYLNRLGLAGMVDSGPVKTKVFPSPFYYEDQVTYYQYGSSYSIANNPKALAQVIYDCHKKYNKRVMALFTSHNTLNGVYRELRSLPLGRDLPIFAQMYGKSRYSILRGMHTSPNGILLGTNAFWEGIDLPGELLEVLIITKLPFDVPSEPVIRAYSNMIDKAGGNSFLDFTIPECVIKFRQGFGRLIRTTSDQGIFIVLDDRVVTKGYGRHFSAVIPTRMQVFTQPEDIRY